MDVKTKDGQELYKLQKQNAMLKLLVGRKIGLNIFYADADDIRVTSGICHVNNGADHCVEKATETKVTVSPIAKWQYVVINNLGNIATREATGTISERPTDPCFQWSGYNPSKQGYYFNKSERIIGAIYRVSSSNWHIINCGENGNEAGENANGTWERSGESQTCKIEVSYANVTIANGANYSSPNFNHPVAFAKQPASAFNLRATPAGACFQPDSSVSATTSSIGLRNQSGADRTGTVAYSAIFAGKWR